MGLHIACQSVCLSVIPKFFKLLIMLYMSNYLSLIMLSFEESGSYCIAHVGLLVGQYVHLSRIVQPISEEHRHSKKCTVRLPHIKHVLNTSFNNMFSKHTYYSCCTFSCVTTQTLTWYIDRYAHVYVNEPNCSTGQ